MTPRQQGYAANGRGQSIEDNPHAGHAAREWRDGFLERERDEAGVSRGLLYG